MNKNIWITLKKELRSIFRDKKTLMRLLLFPLIIPFIIILYGEMFESLDDTETYYTVGVNYKVDAPTEEMMKASGLHYEYLDSLDKLEEAYEDKKIDGYITYDQENKVYNIYVDQASNQGMLVAEAASAYLESYSTYLTNQYLVGEGVDLEAAYNTFGVEYKELSTKNYILSIVISVCVTYIIMAIVIATGNMATGATATERENGTLETILTFPIKKNELILGKYLSSVTIGLISALVAFVLMIISIIVAKSHYTMFEDSVFAIDAKIIVISLLVILVASLFIAGIALALCGMAKSYKEAQSSVSFLNMITIVPMFLSLAEVDIKSIYYLIPVFNHEQILLDIFNNNFVFGNLVLTIVSSIVYIVVVIWLVIKAYNSEKVLFAN